VKYLIFLLIIFLNYAFSANKYLDNHSCDECHEKIYSEFQSSRHSKGYFNDELHRKVADKVSRKKYSCATCHMPMANNIKELISGEARPDKNNKTHTDAISCYFCHTIAYVRSSHKFNINTKARQAKGEKPTLYGRLTNPDDSDKHASVNSPIYTKNACIGCHSHKLNDNNVTIFRAMNPKQNSESCVKCHMPELEGGNEKINKKTRSNHASHKFLGIFDAKFRATGMDINITATKNSIEVLLTNKMDHPIIVQPARAKYLEIKVIRDKKVIWKNYDKKPSEDKKAFFEYTFADKDGKQVIIPSHATKNLRINNIEAYESKALIYNKIKLEKGDIIKASMYVNISKKDCTKVVDIKEEKYIKTYLIKSVEIKFN